MLYDFLNKKVKLKSWKIKQYILVNYSLKTIIIKQKWKKKTLNPILFITCPNQIIENVASVSIFTNFCFRHVTEYYICVMHYICIFSFSLKIGCTCGFFIHSQAFSKIKSYLLNHTKYSYESFKFYFQIQK